MREALINYLKEVNDEGRMAGGAWFEGGEPVCPLAYAMVFLRWWDTPHTCGLHEGASICLGLSVMDIISVRVEADTVGPASAIEYLDTLMKEKENA